MRQIAVGNFVGAKKRWLESSTEALPLEQFEARCICSLENGQPVRIKEAIAFIEEVTL